MNNITKIGKSFNRENFQKVLTTLRWKNLKVFVADGTKKIITKIKTSRELTKSYDAIAPESNVTYGENSIWQQPMLVRIADLLVFLFYATGICGSLNLTFRTKFGLLYTFLMVAFFYGLLTVVFLNKWTAIIAGGVFVGAGALLFFTGMLTSGAEWLYNFMFVQIRVLDQWGEAFPLALVITFTVSTICYILIHKLFNIHVLLFAAIALFAVEWITMWGDIFPYVCVTTMGLMVMYARTSPYVKKAQSVSAPPRSMIQLFVVGFALILVVFTNLFLPKNTKDLRLAWFVERFDWINDLLEEAKTEDRKRDFFDLSLVGLYNIKMADTDEENPEYRLGGAVAPNEAPVMRVTVDRNVLIYGNYKNKYTGYSWVNSLPNNQRSIGVSFWENELAETFDHNRPNRDNIPEDLYNRLFSDITVEIYTQAEGTQTYFSAGRFKNMMASSKTITGYFDKTGILFSPTKVPSSIQYLMYIQVYNRNLPEILSKDNPPVVVDFDDAIQELYDRELLEFETTGKMEALKRDYADLPKTEMIDEITELAKQITAGAKNPYQQAVMLEQYLKNTDVFTYSLDPVRPPDPAYTKTFDFVHHFLLANNGGTKTGYCTYFASAMTVMAQSLGLPARYVEGFSTWRNVYGEDVFMKNGSYYLKNRDAHAWTEVFIDGLGWMTFNPTPGDDTVKYTEQRIYDFPDDEPGSDPTEPSTMGTDPTNWTQVEPDTHESNPYALAVLGGGLLLFFGGFALLSMHTATKYDKNRLSRNRSPEKQLAILYKDMRNMLQHYGGKMEIADTPYTYAKRMDEEYSSPYGKVEDIANIVVKSRYSTITDVSEKDLDTVYMFHVDMRQRLKTKLGKFGYFTNRILMRLFGG